ncbi:hypothetical protein NQ318_006087 [Aromia moschata]|uniref:Uncharacterized protein n=1 Tax=Aromia moschata TaxID=1265417 RepID=A0AAV8Z3V7_9CUCU|nr:hypothetical protein NQ318_006087 [Aromia moschata]
MSHPIDLRPVGGLTLNDLLRNSGDEEYLNINNLPGSQLLAPAEVKTKDTDVDEDAANATAVGLLPEKLYQQIIEMKKMTFL